MSSYSFKDKLKKYVFGRTLARVLRSQIWTFCFLFIYIVTNNLILDEQPRKMEELKWNMINNNNNNNNNRTVYSGIFRNIQQYSAMCRDIEDH